MLIDLVFVGFMFLLAIPAVTGYFAQCYGRSFWLWFAIGCFLPVISNFILIFMVKNYKKVQANDRWLTQYEDEHMDKIIQEILVENDQLSNTKREI